MTRATLAVAVDEIFRGELRDSTITWNHHQLNLDGMTPQVGSRSLFLS